MYMFTCRFVRYDSMFSALAAIRKLNNTRWGDQTIAVTWTNSPTGTSHDSKGSVFQSTALHPPIRTCTFMYMWLCWQVRYRSKEVDTAQSCLTTVSM